MIITNNICMLCIVTKRNMFRESAVLILVGLSCVYGVADFEKLEVTREITYSDTHANVEPVPTDPKIYNKQRNAEHWHKIAKSFIEEKLKQRPNTATAKNVILFMGDGMSNPTVAAARTLMGQRKGEYGEESEFSFEKFPYTGLSKTYCANSQVGDSCCAATAYLCGVKANSGTVGVTAAVDFEDCAAHQNVSNHARSIARWFQAKGKRTGMVTTTRLTHASPTGVYANVASREWESDRGVRKSGCDPKLSPDIAYQMIHGDTGKALDVMLGGGRKMLLPHNVRDEDGTLGERGDGRNLINEWEIQKSTMGKSYQYISNTSGLLAVPDRLDYLLGIFSSSNMDYNLERDPEIQPSLEEMTKTAIKVLSGGDQGYFLFVEGGRIDQAHHNAFARIALDETIEFDKAVSAALNMVNLEDTLIVVTADHSHTMSINGYPVRGNDILGMVGTADDMLPFTTLSYANGPGYRMEEKGRRYDMSQDNWEDIRYHYPGLYPTIMETHGGDDVSIYAIGPWAHFFTGVMEQHTIPHIIAYAACVNRECDDDNSELSFYNQ